MNFPTIETDRLILKRLSPEDISYIFDNLSKTVIMETLGHLSEEDYLKEEHKHKNGYCSYDRKFLMFLLTDKASGRIIGRCGIHNWSKEHRRAEIGYVMTDELFKRKGLMTEAVKAVIEHAFNELNLNRLEAIVRIGNVPSLRIMEKHRFRKEAVMRQHAQGPDGFEDSNLFAMLHDEYRKEKSME